MADIDTLNVNQLHGVSLVLGGHSVADIASACDVSVRTVYRWKNMPAFRAAMSEAAEIILEDGTSYSRAAFEAAWQQLNDYAHGGHVNNERVLNLIRIVREATRTRDVFERISENRELMERIRRLEHESGQGGTNGRVIPFWQREA